MQKSAHIAEISTITTGSYFLCSPCMSEGLVCGTRCAWFLWLLLLLCDDNSTMCGSFKFYWISTNDNDLKITFK